MLTSLSLLRFQLKEAEAIYDEVDDETFGDVYKKRLDAPDFVVEDSKESTGYADNGMEDYDREYSSEDGECHIILKVHILDITL